MTTLPDNLQVLDLEKEDMRFSKDAKLPSTLQYLLIPVGRNLLRAVTRQECPWLPRDLAEGERIEVYTGYVCELTAGSTAILLDSHQGFFEVPSDAIDW